VLKWKNEVPAACCSSWHVLGVLCLLVCLFARSFWVLVCILVLVIFFYLGWGFLYVSLEKNNLFLNLDMFFFFFAMKHGRTHYPSLLQHQRQHQQQHHQQQQQQQQPPPMKNLKLKLPAAEACRERWRRSFRPPTELDLGRAGPFRAREAWAQTASFPPSNTGSSSSNGDNSSNTVLRFLDPSTGAALVVQANRVEGKVIKGLIQA
jgi:hypothetical protein